MNQDTVGKKKRQWNHSFKPCLKCDHYLINHLFYTGECIVYDCNCKLDIFEQKLITEQEL